MPHINRLYFKFRNFLSCQHPKLYCFCDNRKSVIKFFFAGCVASTTDLVFLYIFHSLFHWGIVVSTSLAFILSFIVSFNLQKFWTFRNFNNNKTARQFALYMLNAFVTLNLNGIFMHTLVVELNIWYLLSQVIVNVVIGIYNFFIYRLVVFKNVKHEINNEQKTSIASAGDLA
ncbi:MAG: GtrA family protein [Patescibacteria group bacterium]